MSGKFSDKWKNNHLEWRIKNLEYKKSKVRELKLFYLGILLGIFGNIFASIMYDNFIHDYSIIKATAFYGSFYVLGRIYMEVEKNREMVENEVESIIAYIERLDKDYE